MKSIRLLFCIISSFLGVHSGYAQQGDTQPLGLYVIGLPGDSVATIRWAPKDMASWHWGNENGYRLYRYTTGLNGVRDSIQGMVASKIVLDSFINPLPENAWSNVEATTNQINLAKGAIYAESFVVDSMIGASSLARAYADQADRESRYVFGLFAADQDFDIAEAMGLGYRDTTALPNRIYYYAIELLGDIDSNAVAIFGVEVDMADTFEMAVPPMPQMEQAVDSVIMISCDVSLLADSYVSYNFERSKDSLVFEPVNELPVIASDEENSFDDSIYFSDKVDSVGVWYYYRYYGRTPFGESGPPSPALKVKTSPSPKSSPPIISNLSMDGEDVKIDWTFPQDEESLISKFRIYRSKNPAGPYNLLDSVGVTVRTWTDVYPIASAYYRVAGYDVALVEVYAGEKLMQLQDSIPPDAPENLSCAIDASGKVKISWSSVEDPSLKGYRVFSGNAEEGIYAEQTNFVIEDTSFSFSVNLNTLTQELYLKVQAVDIRQNYSEYSEPCMAMRPDIVPPSRPILVKALPLVVGVSIEWISSSSDDVASHQLQRRWVDDAEWVTLVEFDTSGTIIGTPLGVAGVVIDDGKGKLRDTLAAYPNEYKYRLVALDYGENASSSDILNVRPYDNGERGLITDLEIDSGFDAQLVKEVNTLSWNYSHLQGLYDFQIYRSVDDKPMRAYATTNGRGGINFADVPATSGLAVPASGAFNWKDAELGTAKMLAHSGAPGAISGTSMQRKFKYKIMARHFDGGWSQMSEVVEIEVWVPGN